MRWFLLTLCALLALVTAADAQTIEGTPYFAGSQSVTGSANSSSSSTPAAILAAPNSPLRNYLQSLQCSNQGATTVTTTLNDLVSSTFIVPANGGTNLEFPSPLVGEAATALTFLLGGTQAGTVPVTVFCNGQGYMAN